ncbi:MAG TPA: Gldg family protein [Planctomycetota bacterium]|nr:Gldg family protein [Planctomycetota bacterium]
MIRRHVVQAIFGRNFFSYFGSPTGYVFIAVFIGASSIAAFWLPAFFGNNLADLGTLNEVFPILLTLFIPAISMSVWAEERKQGTDELLLTLPVTDVEIVVGKYLSVLGIYSVALLFSLTNVIILEYLGNPDLGVMIGTYMGYWFLGGALIAVAMVASQLTSSQTVAFILGAIFCAVPVFLNRASTIAGGRLQGWLEGLGVSPSFFDLASGVVSIQSLLYFSAFAVVFLYANLILLARRHLEKGEQLLHLGARTLSLVVIGIALGVLAGRTGTHSRVDLTQERLHTLTEPTRKIIAKIDSGRPVYIQAYISPDVPVQYVEQRETLIGLLKEFDAIGGGRIQLRIVDTERYSPEARLAEDQFGIKAATVRDSSEGEEDAEGIYLGVAFTCGSDSVVIPFFNRGLSVEYELTRSIGTVSGTQRRRIGIANTDAKIFGGMDFQTMSQSPEWEILGELKKQYDVVQIGVDTPITEKIDALIVAQVSSLTQAQMNILMAYIRQGGPTLLFDDPFPQFNPRLAPGEQKSSPRQPMMGMMPPPPSEPKGDITKFCSDLGFQFPTETIIWDTYNPHPRFNLAPREILFIGQDRFNQNDPITSGLQEMVLLNGGEVRPQGALPLNFTPLLTTTPISGGLLKSQLFQSTFFGIQRVEPQYRPRGQAATLAARIKGAIPAAPAAPGQPPTGPGANVNLVFVADLDCISNLFFQLRSEGSEGAGGLTLDNITFILNCVDVLAGDESYVELRKRRPKHRTLERFEKLTKVHNQKMLDETKEAEERAEKELDAAKARLKAKVDEIRNRTDFDERRKEMEIRNVEEVENKRYAAAQREIEEKKKGTIERSRSTMKQGVSTIKKEIRLFSFLLAPVPALIVGLYMFVRRLSAQGRSS